MEIKGTAFLARHDAVVADFGEAAWRTFLTEFAKKDPVFTKPVLPMTWLPVDSYLRFSEELLARFYKNDPKAYWAFGESASEHALTKGQLKAMFAQADYRRFLQFFPGVWKSYFTAGTAQVEAGERSADLRITGVPISHTYFEYITIGFMKRGLEVLGAKNVRTERLKGFSQGDNEVHYRFYFGA
ncbi:hypothetical protein HPC49_16740 [Pyxidicoccus fallax]|uniref:Heme NO-binding domain-containing protein n=1 Tax=Pyxidicoccus fallax TaxID=394095 RepID=A0A848LJA3_9BACT|nr:hypothetical protein [Pyxidicoccus fallax]NMO17825.1 hypothetical protein [Pyxidicoccus fallax]NPC79865.1 hypothetical protein [Pyxidicoccus fallax]